MNEITANIVIIAVVLVILGAAAAYIIREKKRGSKCIGCPHAKECAARRNGGCSGNHQ